MSEFEQWEQELKELAQPEAENEQDAPARAQAEKEFEQAVVKAINRRIRKVCLKTIAIVAVIAVVVFLGVNPLLNVLCPSPKHLSRTADISLDEYLSAYYETMQPYAEVVPIASTVSTAYDDSYDPYDYYVTRRGFGCYTVRLDVVDRSVDGWAHIGAHNVKVQLNWGQYKVLEDPNRNLTSGTIRFGYARTAEEIYEVVEGLPRSSKVYLNVRADSPVTLEELRQSSVTPLWMEVYNDTSEWRGGLNLRNSVSRTEDDWRENMDDDQLRAEYLANLDTILSVPRMLRQLYVWQEVENNEMEGYSGGVWYAGGLSSKVEYIEEARDAVAAQSGPLMTERYCVYGSRDEVLEFLETADIRWVGIENMFMQNGTW